MRRLDDTKKTTASADESGQVVGAALQTMVEVAFKLTNAAKKCELMKKNEK
jgi:hypothetical protein